MVPTNQTRSPGKSESSCSEEGSSRSPGASADMGHVLGQAGPDLWNGGQKKPGKEPGVTAVSTASAAVALYAVEMGRGGAMANVNWGASRGLGSPRACVTHSLKAEAGPGRAFGLPSHLIPQLRQTGGCKRPAVGT